MEKNGKVYIEITVDYYGNDGSNIPHIRNILLSDAKPHISVAAGSSEKSNAKNSQKLEDFKKQFGL